MPPNKIHYILIRDSTSEELKLFAMVSNHGDFDQLGKSDLVGVGLEDKYKYPPPHDYPRAVSLTSNKIQTLANNT